MATSQDFSTSPEGTKWTAVKQKSSRRNRFFVYVAVALSAAVLWGFGPTYFLRAFITTRDLRLLVHIHGFLFSCWIALFVVQTVLISKHRTNVHRQIGVWAILLIVAVVAVGIAVDLSSIPDTQRTKVFADGPVVSLVRIAGRNAGNPIIFGLVISAGLLLRRHPESHKRLMLLGTIAIMNAPMARILDELGWPIQLTAIGFVAPGNWFNRIVSPALGPSGFSTLFALPFFLALVAYDIMSIKRIHPSTVLGGVVVFLFRPLFKLILKVSGF
jgi:hypothetical protein